MRALHPWLALLLVGGAVPWPQAWGRDGADAVAPSPRFAVQATLVPLQRSDDGRYTLAAQARLVPGAGETAAPGTAARFTLRPAGMPDATCEPFTDILFAHGFESP